jgi:CDP-diacylglycerol--glycerol-3-phosphate 3-phosphatidyltransferase
VGLLEYLRARAGNARAAHVDVITLGERPQRIICCAIAVGLAGLVPARAVALAGWSVAVLLALTVIGLAQLTVAVRRMLR